MWARVLACCVAVHAFTLSPTFCIIRDDISMCNKTNSNLNSNFLNKIQILFLKTDLTSLPFCLSICQTHVLWQNERNLCLHSYTIWKIIHPSFLTRRMVSTWNLHFTWRKSDTEFLCVNTLSGKVCKVFIGLSICAKMVHGGCPVLRQNLAETDPSLQKHRFSVVICS